MVTLAEMEVTGEHKTMDSHTHTMLYAATSASEYVMCSTIETDFMHLITEKQSPMCFRVFF